MESRCGGYMNSEELDWESFDDSFKWRQGEHLTAIGHTGSGKSTLINAVLPRRKYVVFLATKKKDERYTELKRAGFKELKRFEPSMFETYPKQLVKPPFPRDARKLRIEHSARFGETLSAAYEAEGWTVVPDEIRHLSQFLKLDDYLELLWQQGRALNITVVGGTQRPAHVPLSAYSAATHLFLWRDNDKRNLQRFSEIGAYFDPRELQDTVRNLPEHTFLYLNRNNGRAVISRTPAP